VDHAVGIVTQDVPNIRCVFVFGRIVAVIRIFVFLLEFQ